MNIQHRTAKLDSTAQSVIVKILLRHGIEIRENDEHELMMENTFGKNGVFATEYIPLPRTVQETRNWLGY